MREQVTRILPHVTLPDIDGFADISTAAMEKALVPLGDHLLCDLCREALTERINILIQRWSMIKVWLKITPITATLTLKLGFHRRPFNFHKSIFELYLASTMSHCAARSYFVVLVVQPILSVFEPSLSFHGNVPATWHARFLGAVAENRDAT